MPKPTNINAVPPQFIDEGSTFTTHALGAAAGSEKIYVNIDYVQPGAVSTKYHSHSKQEEFFLILSGAGMLRMDGEEVPVTTGDFIAKPAGKGIAHQFINTGTEVLQILDCGNIKADDIITYPDEDVIYIKRERKAYKASDALPNWTSDPEAT